MAAGDLYAWMEAAERCGVDQVQFGNRQQLYCRVEKAQVKDFKKELDQLSVFYEANDDEYPNILTSYVAEDVFQNANWLSEGVYKDILGLFDYKPRLKISLVDANQTFIPFFTGNINFISSPGPYCPFIFMSINSLWPFLATTVFPFFIPCIHLL